MSPVETTPTTPRRKRKLWKILFWGTLLILSTLIGGGIFAYTYATDSATLAALIREQAPRFLPHCTVEAQRVKVHPFIGEVTLRDVSIHQYEAKGNPHLLGRFPWIHLAFDPWAMLDNRFEPRLVVIAQPLIRLKRRADGSWNVQGLLADPWPMPASSNTPPIRIENGTVELIDETLPQAKSIAVLREVSIEIDPSNPDASILSFAGSARGHLFERAHIEGTIERTTGRMTLKGDVLHLSVPEILRAPLPLEARPVIDLVKLTSGEADISIRKLVFDPKTSPMVHHESVLRLRSAVCIAPALPFTINDLSATIKVQDDQAVIERAEGFNGSTTIKANGTIALAGPEQGSFDLFLDVLGLEMDERLKQWTPQKFKPLWAEYAPSGRVDISWNGIRKNQDEEIDWRLGVNLRDVGMQYHLFKYPLEHVTGQMNCRQDLIEFNLSTAQIGGKPASAVGKVVRPGPNPAITIDFAAEAMPIDKRLRDAMPPDVRNVVDTFSPGGTVRGTARLTRTPVKDGEDPKKAVRMDAALDLNPGCEVTWDGMKYKVSNLTGHLEIHPDLWIFRDMLGYHGQSEIRGSGRVARLGPAAFDVALELDADNLLFDQQLRDALPTGWRKTWSTLNPSGAIDVEATIKVKPGARDNYHLVIHPRPETNLRLAFERAPDVGETESTPESRRLEMRLEEISGLFVFDNGKVHLHDGGFTFHGSPVTFDEGEVQVFDTGQFALTATNLYVKDFRFDAGLRKMMPPVMAQFARRLDDGKSFTMRTNLGLSWSGKLSEQPSCTWDKGLVVLNGNSVMAGVPIRHIQGQVDNLSGWFNGRDLFVRGALDLSSVNLFDQQILNVTSPIEVDQGKLRLTNIEGILLDGKILGDLELTLDRTPRFQTNLTIDRAQLERYAATIPGKQSFGGLVSGRMKLSGLGNDMHSLQGDGEARITQGDLGRLPGIVRLLRAIQLAQNTKTAFDSAYVNFAVRNGVTTFNPIQLTGDAFSLLGGGTLDPQGELDIKLSVIYGRDSWHIPVISDAVREATNPFFAIRVSGTAGSPVFKPVAIPLASDFVKSLGIFKKSESTERRRRQ